MSHRELEAHVGKVDDRTKFFLRGKCVLFKIGDRWYWDAHPPDWV